MKCASRKPNSSIQRNSKQTTLYESTSFDNNRLNQEITVCKTTRIGDRYYIDTIPHNVATEIVINNHYLHRTAPCSFSFGLIDKTTKEIMGVIIYGTPSSAPLRKGICGEDEQYNVIELTRLWIDDSVGKNGESFLIGNTLRLVNKEIIVSFAEIQQGHVGIVYQATNWIYTGLSAKRTNWTVDGIDKHCQTIADKYTSKQLKALYGNKFKLVDRPRKHRYVYFNCNKRRKKELLKKLRYDVHPYPKASQKETEVN